MAELEAGRYIDHVDTLEKYKGHCVSILGDVEQALSSLEELERKVISLKFLIICATVITIRLFLGENTSKSDISNICRV